MRSVAAGMVLAWLALAAPVRAESVFKVRALGTGFTDTTPVAPVGGNTGTTLGEQRKQVVQFAADLWGKVLDSNVPIEVAVNFTAMGCKEGGLALASTSPAGYVVFDTEPIGEPDTAYPYALASRLAGYDVDPDTDDMFVSVNTSVDDRTCRTRSLDGFYYGLDGSGPAYQDDLVSTLLHELGHGLGFVSMLDKQTGEPFYGPELDVYSAHLHDLSLGRGWRQLTGAQRVQSLQTPRGLVFDGPQLNAAAPGFLTAGTPALTLSPSVAGFVGLVADTDFAPSSALAPVRAEIAVLDATASCSALVSPERASGRITLINITALGCRASEVAQVAQQAGAVGVLFAYPSSGLLPAPLAELTPKSTVPVLTLSEVDARLLYAALQRGSITASLGGDANQRLGADKKGRALLFTPDEILGGSSLSHFDISARPDLLMEPYRVRGAQHDVDLTLPLMRDLGWTSLCGNGVMDYGEECDAAQQNGDGAGAPCRSKCLLPGCGDGLMDPGEACDEGRDNSDTLPGACRTGCTRASCGDGVIDPEEQCDDGMQNGEQAPAKCSLQCTPVTAPLATDAGTPEIDAPDDDVRPVLDAAVMVEHALEQWGDAGPPPATDANMKSRDDGCRLAEGGATGAWANFVLLWLGFVLVRRRR